MSGFNRWQSGTSALMAIALTSGAVAPLVIHTTSVAQTATLIPVRYDKAERILVTKEEIAPLTLIVTQDVVSSQLKCCRFPAATLRRIKPDGFRQATASPYEKVLIPAGSEVVGELRPASGGSQFRARELVLPTDGRYKINAISKAITKTETVRKGANANEIVKNAALGAAAAAAIIAVTGDRAIARQEILGGANIGALIGLFLGRERVELVAIDPNTDLHLTLGSDFQRRD